MVTRNTIILSCAHFVGNTLSFLYDSLNAKPINVTDLLCLSMHVIAHLQQRKTFSQTNVTVWLFCGPRMYCTCFVWTICNQVFFPLDWTFITFIMCSIKFVNIFSYTIQHWCYKRCVMHSKNVLCLHVEPSFSIWMICFSNVH